MSSLAAAGWIEILKRGTYAVMSPLYSGDIPPFAIAAALIEPMAISHWSACAHHGFTTQIPGMVQASTPRNILTPEMRQGKANRPRGRAVWKSHGYEFEFIHVTESRFWGFSPHWVTSWKQVNITDPERTALDLIARPDIFGGLSASIEILDNSISQIDVRHLVDYALQYDAGSVIKRLGWVLETLGTQDESLERLQAYPVRRYYTLEPGPGDNGQRNSRWHIIENLGRS
jgi:predicted transcriptional regulator of viral defense system